MLLQQTEPCDESPPPAASLTLICSHLISVVSQSHRKYGCSPRGTAALISNKGLNSSVVAAHFRWCVSTEHKVIMLVWLDCVCVYYPAIPDITQHSGRHSHFPMFQAKDKERKIDTYDQCREGNEAV